MDDVYIYFIHLPPGISELVTPCLEGYTIYIDESLDEAHRLKAYEHAIEHIRSNDFERADVQTIEAEAHENAP